MPELILIPDGAPEPVRQWTLTLREPLGNGFREAIPLATVEDHVALVITQAGPVRLAGAVPRRAERAAYPSPSLVLVPVGGRDPEKRWVLYSLWNTMGVFADGPLAHLNDAHATLLLRAGAPRLHDPKATSEARDERVVPPTIPRKDCVDRAWEMIGDAPIEMERTKTGYALDLRDLATAVADEIEELENKALHYKAAYEEAMRQLGREAYGPPVTGEAPLRLRSETLQEQMAAYRDRLADERLEHDHAILSRAVETMAQGRSDKALAEAVSRLCWAAKHEGMEELARQLSLAAYLLGGYVEEHHGRAPRPYEDERRAVVAMNREDAGCRATF